MKLFITKTVHCFQKLLWDILTQTSIIPIKYSKTSVGEILIGIWYNSEEQC